MVFCARSPIISGDLEQFLYVFAPGLCGVISLINLLSNIVVVNYLINFARDITTKRDENNNYLTGFVFCGSCDDSSWNY